MSVNDIIEANTIMCKFNAYQWQMLTSFRDDSTQIKIISRIEYKNKPQKFSHTHTISCFVCLFVWP